MALMCSTESLALNSADRQTLLDTAYASLRHGLLHGAALPVEPTDYPPALRKLHASFVTLNKAGRLRGCIGSLQACRPLITDIAENAYAAGFRDPRFPPLSTDELDQLDIHLSLLNPAEAIQFDSEADLLAQLRPGIDGLVLQDGTHRGTFLPSVWDSLPAAEDFLRQLKLKAGLAPDYWSPELQVSRYTVESIAGR